MHYNNNPSIKSLQVAKKVSCKIIHKAFKAAGKLQKTGAQRTQCNMGGDTDLKFPLASGLFKNPQLQYKHTLLKKKKKEETSSKNTEIQSKSDHLLIFTLVTQLIVEKASSKTTL